MCFRPAEVNVEKKCPQCGAANPFEGARYYSVFCEKWANHNHEPLVGAGRATVLDVGGLGLLQKSVDQNGHGDGRAIDDLRIKTAFDPRFVPDSEPLGLDFGRNGNAIIVAKVFFGAAEQNVGEIPVFPVMNFWNFALFGANSGRCFFLWHG